MTGAGSFPPPRVYAVLNPACRRYDEARDLLLAAVRDAGWQPPAILTTTIQEPGGPQAAQAVAEGADLVVVGGGDGTVREVAGILASSGVRLGLLPLGTANLFARNMGIRPRRLASALQVALHGRSRPIDLGWAAHRVADEWSADRPFLVLAGLGHDAATVLATRPEYKRRLGWAAYLGAGARHLFRAPIAMTLQADDAPPRDVDVWCVLAGNCGRVPGGVRVFPHARPDDGVLDTLAVPLTSPWQWLGIAANGVLPSPRPLSALTYGHARTLTVTPASPQPLQLDGDVVERVAEVRIRVAAAALAVSSALPAGAPPTGAPS